MTYRIAAIMTLVAAFAACSPNSSDKPAEKPQGVVSEAQKKTMEDARKTEELLKEANDKRMKEADQ